MPLSLYINTQRLLLWRFLCRNGSEAGGECALTPLSRSDCSSSPPPMGSMLGAPSYSSPNSSSSDIKPLLVDTSVANGMANGGGRGLRSPMSGMGAHLGGSTGGGSPLHPMHMAQGLNPASMAHHSLRGTAISTNLWSVGFPCYSLFSLFFFL